MSKIKAIQLEPIILKGSDLLFYKSFIDKLGGQKRARLALLDIIGRYFHPEYIDWETLNED